jgi:hypothetical protein
VYNLHRDDSWRFHLLDEAPKAALTHERMEILRAVGHGHETPKDIATLLGKPADAVRKTLERLVEGGQVQKIAYGKFGLL